MKTPYEILNVRVDASDNEIKQAYLQKVKESPPDRDQELFQIIQNAYQSIKDHKSRIEYDLFNFPTPDFNNLVDHALSTPQKLQLDSKFFNKLLQAGVDDLTLQKAIPNTDNR